MRKILERSNRHIRFENEYISHPLATGRAPAKEVSNSQSQKIKVEDEVEEYIRIKWNE